MVNCILKSAILAVEDNSQAQTYLLIGLALMFITMLMWRGKSRRKNVEKLSSLQSQRHQIRSDNVMRDEANSMMIKLAELSREICGQIDTRYAKLEHAIIEADRKIGELEKLSKLIAAQAGCDNPTATDAPQAQQITPPANPAHEKIFQLSEDGIPNVEIARQMNIPTGEVELILSLERNRRSQAKKPENPSDENPISPPSGNTKPAGNNDKPSGFDARA